MCVCDDGKLLCVWRIKSAYDSYDTLCLLVFGKLFQRKIYSRYTVLTPQGHQVVCPAH